MSVGGSERAIVRFFYAAFLACLLLLVFPVSLGADPNVRLALSLFLFLISPGLVPALLLRRKLGLTVLEALPFAVSFSLGQAALVLLVFDGLPFALPEARWALAVMTAAWCVWVELKTRLLFAVRSDGFTAAPGVSKLSRAVLTLALLGLVVGVGVLLLGTGAPLTWDADSAAHLSAIRGVVEEGSVFPAAQPYGPNGPQRPDPRFGIFHALAALLMVSSGVKIEVLWAILPAFFGPLLVLAYFFAARRITGNAWVAYLATLLFPLCYGGSRMGAMWVAGYPNRVSMLVYLVSLGVFFAHLKERGRWLLVVLGILMATAAAVHVYYFIEFVFVISCFFLVKLVADWGRRTETAGLWVTTCGVVVGAALPLLIYRFVTSYSAANPYAVEGQGNLYLWDGAYIVDPFKTFSWLGAVGLVTILMFPRFLVGARRRDSHAFVGAATAGPLALMFNPILVPMASTVINYLTARLVWAVPYTLSAALFIGDLKGNVTTGSLRGRLYCGLVYVLLGLALFATVDGKARFYHNIVSRKERAFPEDLAAPARVLERLDEITAGRKVILSDPVTAYAIPAFSRHYVTAIPVAHAAPTDPHPVSRIRDAMDVLNAGVSAEKTVSILRQYSVDFVVVNTGFSRRLSAFEYEIDPTFQERALRKMTSLPGVFEPVLAEKNLHVFRVLDLESFQYVRDSATPGVGEEEIPDTGEGVPTGGVPNESVPAESIADFSGLFSLEEAVLDRRAAQPGDTVRIGFRWRCISPLPSEDVYKLYIRMESSFPRGPLFSEAYEKPYRKLLERRLGKRLRFRADVDPENSDRPLHLWKRGERIHQIVPVPVSPDLVPGEYSVRVSLRRTSFLNNYRFSDYLKDEDYYSGVEIGRLHIGAGENSGFVR
ncbi:MAG: hypothetical protein V2A71_04620 [Candidatus Eisenbacteria bacterium]